MESFGTISMWETSDGDLIVEGVEDLNEDEQRVVLSKDEGIFLMEWLSRVTVNQNPEPCPDCQRPVKLCVCETPWGRGRE